MIYYAKQPIECDDKEINDFCNVLRTSNLVMIDGIKSRVLKSHYLSFCYSGLSYLIGIRSIKNPIQSYKEHIFSLAEISELNDLLKYEYGWYYVDPHYRSKGIGDKLFHSLNNTVDPKNIYSVVREDNEIMIKKIEKRGMERVGRPFKTNAHNDYYLSIWRCVWS